MGRGSVALVALCSVFALCYGHGVTIPQPEGTDGVAISSQELDAEVLYNYIVQAKYSNAVKISKDLPGYGQGNLITSVALRLAREGNTNLLSYVYQLRTAGEMHIFESYIPNKLKMIFKGSVILKHQKFGMALKLDANLDSDGDRIAWGDAHDQRSHRVEWKFLPLWENNQVHFRIRNVDCSMNLKLAVHPDDIGDRGAFGSVHSGVPFHAWALQPVMIGDEINFYIINVYFNQGLKLALSTDSYGDRRLWGHNGNINSDPLHFAWSIHRFVENRYITL